MLLLFFAVSIGFVGYSFMGFDASFSLSTSLLSFAPLAVVGSTDDVTDAETSEEVEADNSPLTYVVTSLSTMACIGIYNSRSEQVSGSASFLGETLGHRRINSIISNGGIVHSSKGTFLISVSGLELP